MQDKLIWAFHGAMARWLRRVVTNVAFPFWGVSDFIRRVRARHAVAGRMVMSLKGQFNIFSLKGQHYSFRKVISLGVNCRAGE
ncbi:hypothetical protein [Gaoshiqia sediminis]|nr:hypothetical protein [Gaoshiqia sediminis]